MKTIKILQLQLTNFAGLTQTLNPEGSDISISGQNGAGKTRIANAISWLLFGKDMQGKSEFAVKPIGRQQVEASVYAKIDVDGKQYELSRTLQEVWRNVRGKEEAELTSHETKFEIDHNGVQKYKFDEFIKELCPEHIFKLITNPHSFNQLSWQDRRKILFEIIGEVSDLEIAKEHYPDLAGELEKADVETYRSTVAGKRKKTKEQLDDIQPRIDENEKARPDLAQVEDAKSDKQVAENELSKIDEQIQGITSKQQEQSKKKDELYKEIDRLKSEKRNAEQKIVKEAEEEIKRLKQEKQEREKEAMQGINEKLEDERQKLNDLQSTRNEVSEKLTNGQSDIDRLEKQLEKLRQQYREVANESVEPYADQLACPTCNRPYEDKDAETLRVELNESKSKRLEEIQEKAGGIKQEKEAKEKDIETIEANLAELDKQLKEKREEIEQLQNQGQSVDVTDLDEKIKKQDDITWHPTNEKVVELNGKLATIQNQIDKIEKGSNYDVGDLRQQRQKIQEEINTLQETINLEKRDKELQDRISQLKEEQDELTKTLANYQKIEDQLQDLIRKKIETVNERLQSYFNPVTFRMYNQKLNGNLEATCLTMYNNLTWNELSSGEKIKAGLYIIRTLQNHYQVSAPVILDNHEGITENGEIDMPDMECQKVKMYAREEENLTINVEQQKETV